MMIIINMSDDISLQKIRDFSGGMNTEVSDNLTPTNTMRLILNMDLDVLGTARVRKGLTAIGGQTVDNKSSLGLYHFKDSGSGTNNQQIACVNNSGGTYSVTYYNASGTWTAIGSGSSFTASAKFRFETFLDLVFLVNSAADSPKSWTGATASSWGTTQLTSAPSGKFIKLYKSRLYIAGTTANPDRLYFSSIPDTSNNITWDTTNDWLDINPSDGQNITGLERNGTQLLIFKNRSMYRWNGSATDADLIVDVGCSSQESIHTRNGITFFFNPQGVYATSGGYPTRISRQIQRWIDAIPAAYYDDVSGITDEDNYYCSIGDVTVDGVAYTNVVLVYNIPGKVWTVRTYPEEILRFASQVESDGTESIMCANDDGDVHTFNYGSTDAGTSIKYNIRTKKMDFGSSGYIKRFSEFFAFGYKLAGADTLVQTEDNNLNSYPDGLLLKWWKRFMNRRHRGRYFIFELQGLSKDGQGEFEGWEIVDLTTDGYVG